VGVDWPLCVPPTVERDRRLWFWARFEGHWHAAADVGIRFEVAAADAMTSEMPSK